MPLMRTATMKSRQAAAALADAQAAAVRPPPGAPTGDLMWRAALMQERADKHTHQDKQEAYKQELADTAAAAAVAQLVELELRKSNAARASGW